MENPGDSWGPGGLDGPSDEEAQQALADIHGRKSRRDRNVRVAGASGIAVAVLLVASAVFLQTDNTKNVVATTSPSTVVKQVKATSTTVAQTTTTLPPRENTYVATLKGLEQIDASGKQTVLVPEKQIHSDLAGAESSVKKIINDPFNGRVWFKTGLNLNCTQKLYYYDLDGRRLVNVGTFPSFDFALNPSATEIAIGGFGSCLEPGDGNGDTIVITIPIKHGVETRKNDKGARTLLDAKIINPKEDIQVNAVTYMNDDELVISSRTIKHPESDETPNPSYVVNTKMQHQSVATLQKLGLGTTDFIYNLFTHDYGVFVVEKQKGNKRRVLICTTDGKTLRTVFETTYDGTGTTRMLRVTGVNENTGEVFYSKGVGSDGKPGIDYTMYKWSNGKTTVVGKEITAADQ